MSIDRPLTAPRPEPWQAWYLPALVALLVAATVAQVAWSVPRFVNTATQFGLRVPTPLEATAQVPAWAALVVGLLIVGIAARRRSSYWVPAAFALAAFTAGGLLALMTVSCQETLLLAMAK